MDLPPGKTNQRYWQKTFTFGENVSSVLRFSDVIVSNNVPYFVSQEMDQLLQKINSAKWWKIPKIHGHGYKSK